MPAHGAVRQPPAVERLMEIPVAMRVLHIAAGTRPRTVDFGPIPALVKLLQFAFSDGALAGVAVVGHGQQPPSCGRRPQ